MLCTIIAIFSSIFGGSQNVNLKKKTINNKDFGGSQNVKINLRHSKQDGFVYLHFFIKKHRISLESLYIKIGIISKLVIFNLF